MFEHKIAEPVTWYSEVIPDKLIDLMVEEIEKLNSEQYETAQIGQSAYSRGVEDLSIRNSKINWLNNNNLNSLLLFRRLQVYFVKKYEKQTWIFGLVEWIVIVSILWLERQIQV